MSGADPSPGPGEAVQRAAGGAEGDLPEAAERRLRGQAYVSALSIPELAACVHLGMRPVGLVQGFCAMSWNFSYSSLAGSPYGGSIIDTYRCPHPYVTDAEHPRYGWNLQCTDMQDAWAEGYNLAYRRLMEEATAAGAHGVIGVTDATKSLVGPGVREFHLYGTAVVIEGAAPPEGIWSTYLAGQRLAKLFEAGLLPVSVIASIAAVRIQPACVTEILERGRWDNYVAPDAEIRQLSDAHTSARRLARDHLKARLGTDELHGAQLDVREFRSYGHEVISAELRGTRVRRFRDVEPLAPPVPTVRLV